jgi:hypothetical protein
MEISANLEIAKQQKFMRDSFQTAAASLLSLFLAYRAGADSASSTNSTVTTQPKMDAVTSILSIRDTSFEIDSHVAPPVILGPPVCFVSILNKSTNLVECLKMPITNLCVVKLLDDKGKEVAKTAMGEYFGNNPSQKDIQTWFKNWTNRHESSVLRIVPNGTPRFAGRPTDFLQFSLHDLFEVREPGNYELHVSARIIEPGVVLSNSVIYAVTLLPEAVTKVQIRDKDMHP